MQNFQEETFLNIKKLNYMKKILALSLVLLLSASIKAQKSDIVPVDENTNLITYKEVVNVKGSADTLYLRAINWFNVFYKNPADVTKVRDREGTLIVGKHRIGMKDFDEDGNMLPARKAIGYTIKIECKEGRYRYTITDLNLRQTSYFPLERWITEDDAQYCPTCTNYLEQIDAFVKELIESLTEGMKPPVVIKDEW